MKFLLKILCLLSLLSSFSFSADAFFFKIEDANNYLKKSNVKFLANNKYVMFDRPDDPVHVYVDRVYSYDTYFYAGSLRGYFWNNQTGDVYYISNDVKTNYFLDGGGFGPFIRRYEYSGTYNHNAEFLTFVSIYEFHKTNVAVCNVGEEFNTETMQCVSGCPAGQLWNVNTNSCVVDCSDEDNHKFFTSDYKCIDCSSALTKSEIAKTGLSSVSSQIVSAIKHTTAITVRTIISVELNQSCSLPWSSINCKQPTPRTNKTSPTVSIG